MRAVQVSFEFLPPFRQKIGSGRLTVEVAGGTDRPPTVLDALAALELRLVERGAVRPGVLVFLKSSIGGLQRVLHADRQAVQEGQCLVLATAMEGG